MCELLWWGQLVIRPLRQGDCLLISTRGGHAQTYRSPFTNSCATVSCPFQEAPCNDVFPVSHLRHRCSLLQQQPHNRLMSHCRKLHAMLSVYLVLLIADKSAPVVPAQAHNC